MSAKNKKYGSLVLLAAWVWTVSASPGLARAGVAVLPPHADVQGETLQQWSAQWWQYVFSVPQAQSPVLDPTGADAAVNQSGRVFFLSGSFSLLPGPSQIHRTVNVRPDQYLFFPVVNGWADDLGVNPPMTVAQLRASVAQGVDAITELHASIDGTTIPESELRLHREVSPVFSYTLPRHGILESFGFDDQTVSPAVADGYYLMVAPLAPGPHTVRFGGSEAGTPPFSLDVTYQVNVSPTAAPLPPASMLGLLTLPLALLAWRRLRRQLGLAG